MKLKQLKTTMLLLLSCVSVQVLLVACGGTEQTTTTSETPTTENPEAAATPNSETTAAPKAESKATDSQSVTAKWVDFKTEDGSLAIKFPGEPTTETQTTPSDLGNLEVMMTSYSDNANKQFFMVSSVTYPVKPEEYDVQKGLEGAKNGAAANSGSTIVSDEPSDRFGIPGKKLIMNASQDNQKLTLRAEIYIDPKGPTLHQIMMVVEGDQVDTPAANAFFDSAQITKL